MIRLLSHGEDRLLQAVEKRQIPLNVAVTIATADDEEVQRALKEAYDNNDLRGKRLLAARRIIESRKSGGKKLRSGVNRNSLGRIAGHDVLKAYQEETHKQRVMVHKAKLCETKLLFLVSAFRQLFENPQFTLVLAAESLADLPEYLAQQLGGKRANDVHNE